MAWLKKDDRFPEHKKIRRLTDGAYRMHDTALHACAKDETDGFVTEADIIEMEHGKRLRKHVPALVLADLWHVVEGGWEIHDYLHYNPSHEQKEADREAARERQARWRKGKPVTDVSQRDNGVTTPLVTRTSQPPDPTRPDPTRPLKELGQVGEGKSPKQSGENNTPPIQPCGKAHDDDKPCRACGIARKAAEVNAVDEITAKARQQREAAAAESRARRLAEEAERATIDPEAAKTASAKARQALKAAKGGDS